jgi:hypothetical protein
MTSYVILIFFQENKYAITITHTLKEVNTEEKIIRWKAKYINRAQYVQSLDDFDFLMTDASKTLNEQAISPQYVTQLGEYSKKNLIT